MILRDPVHGLVSFESSEERVVPLLMDTPEVQRLRRVRQLGVASVAFPGAEHSRFSHAVGAAYVMKLLLGRFRQIEGDVPFWQRVTSDRARDALAAAVLHDVGHGPLSHLFEDAIGDSPRHEVWTERVILDPSTGVHRVLAELDPAMPARVAALVRGEHPIAYLAKSVSGTFDVDRCDYLLRDAHATGVRYGVYDLDWLLRSLRFAPAELESEPPALAIDGAKGLPAIEAFLLARLFMFQQVYLHKATRAAEWMIRTALRRAVLVLSGGGKLESTPEAFARAARGESLDLEQYLELDDHALAVAMHGWERSSDAPLADICTRIRNRRLFKSLELFGDQATEKGAERALETARGIARARGLDPMVYVGLDRAVVKPLPSEDEPLTVVFEKGSPRPLRDVSFLLGRLAGQSLTRTRILMAAELRDDVTEAIAD